jgi:hypothetical protein
MVVLGRDERRNPGFRPRGSLPIRPGMGFRPAIRFVIRRPAAILAVFAVALIVSAAAGAELPRVALVAKDQAGAKSIVLTKSDLGGSGWKGGVRKPDLTTNYSCPGFDPKEADLMITGAAETEFKMTVLDIDSEADIYQSPEMVRLDWARTVSAPGLVPCLRSLLVKGLPAGQKLVSLVRMPFPRVVPQTTLIRILIDATVKGTTVRVFSDFVFMARGRTELSLGVVGPAIAAPGARQQEIRLARLLASRAVT